MATIEKTEYRLENLTCASCAMKFEKNVKDLATVQDVQVNFGASKLSVTGNVTIEDLETAGAFDGIKVFPAAERRYGADHSIFIRRKENIVSVLSLVFLLIGCTIVFQLF